MMVSVSEVDAKFAELLKAVEGGETVTICREGVPVAEIVQPKEQSTARNPKFSTLHGKIVVHNPDLWKAMSDREADDFINGNY